MALRTSARWRSACKLQLRTPHRTPQDGRVFSCSFSAKASTGGEGLNEEENPLSSSENQAEHVLENATQPEQSKELMFKGSIKIGAPYMRFIIGRGGMTKKSIEKTTNAEIVVPPAREVRSLGNVVVKSSSQEFVDKAIEKIKDVLQRAEKNSNLQYSHFISLPLASNKGLVEQLRSFKNSILNEQEEANKYVSWFPETAGKGSSDVSAENPVDKVSKINSRRIVDPDLEGFFSEDDESDDENEHHESPRKSVKVAAAVLEGVQPKVLEILEGREPKLFLRGIECLRGRPLEARVLAMKVIEADNNKHLQQACHAIREAYAKAGLVTAADLNQELTLHATLMNTSLRRSFGNKPFDARKILVKYRLQDWGECFINEVHLSQRFFYDKGGYYRCCGSFQLSQSDDL